MKNIDEITIGELKQLQSLLGIKAEQSSHPYEIGKNYFIRTITHHYTGKLVQVHAGELVLESAAWIADDGRFTQALEKEEFAEVELFPKDRLVVIGRGSILDATPVKNIPVSQK
jgi:hypothetical protein